MCLVEESLTTVEASCSTLKCSGSIGILPVGQRTSCPFMAAREQSAGKMPVLRVKNRLTIVCRESTLRSRFFITRAIGSIAHTPCLMSKVCSITGSRVTRGSVIHRRGMAKKKGGVGRHVTKNVRREFHPNLHEHRVWVPELKKFVRLRVTARGLKTINKNGAYRALKKAGVIAG